METFKNNNVIVWAPYRLITTIIPAYHALRPQAQMEPNRHRLRDWCWRGPGLHRFASLIFPLPHPDSIPSGPCRAVSTDLWMESALRLKFRPFQLYLIYAFTIIADCFPAHTVYLSKATCLPLTLSCLYSLLKMFPPWSHALHSTFFLLTGCSPTLQSPGQVSSFLKLSNPHKDQNTPLSLKKTLFNALYFSFCI